MKLSIPRGIVYHRVSLDIRSFFRALFSNLKDPQPIARFEESFAKYVGAKHCVAFPFARTAIYFSLKSQNFAPGSEIIMPPITIKAMLDVVLACGLKPVFVDMDLETLCFDLPQLKAAISPKTRAVLVTYLLGMVPNLGEIEKTCREHNLFILEDFSQCLNGKFDGKKVGSFGDVGIYSSSSIKTLDTYGGGLLICHDDTLHATLRAEQKTLHAPSRLALLKKIWTDLVRNVATTRWVFHLATFPLIRVMTQLTPEKSIRHVGTRDTQMLQQLPADWFESYTSLQAALGLELISHVDATDALRKANVVEVKNRSEKEGLRFPKGVPGGENVYWQFVTYFSNAFRAQKFFQKRKIDTSTTSLLLIANLPAYPYRQSVPNAQHFHSNGLFIPAYPSLKKSEITRIANSLVESTHENFI